jgi:NAD(P)-dependent dehydrogenase (short-subunit alcohol dehydrogenase family)
LEDKIAIITGGSTGIGRAIAEKYAENNYSVLVLDLKKIYGACHDKIKCIPIDLASQSSVYDAINHIKSNYESVDVLVNNARPYLKSKSLNEALDEFDLAIDVLVKSPLVLSVELSPLMKNGGSIVNIGSTNVNFISQQSIGYHIGKSAIHQMSRYLAVKLSEQSVNVNTVSPGIVDKGKEQTDKFKDVLGAAVPFGRGCTVEEIANLVCFLSMPSAKYITGQEIIIDGGETICDQFSVGSKLMGLEL